MRTHKTALLHTRRVLSRLPAPRAVRRFLLSPPGYAVFCTAARGGSDYRVCRGTCGLVSRLFILEVGLIWLTPVDGCPGDFRGLTAIGTFSGSAWHTRLPPTLPCRLLLNPAKKKRSKEFNFFLRFPYILKKKKSNNPINQ